MYKIRVQTIDGGFDYYDLTPDKVIVNGISLRVSPYFISRFYSDYRHIDLSICICYVGDGD